MNLTHTKKSKDPFGERAKQQKSGPATPNPYWYLYKKIRTDGRLIELAGIVDKEILNIGCFYPYDELMYANLVRRWVAIDVSAESIQYARKEFESRRDAIPETRVKFLVMDSSHMSFNDNEFDVVMCLSVIEHIREYEKRLKVISEMERVTKDFVIITSSDIDHDGYRAFHGSLKYRQFYGEDFYEKLYTKKELLDEIKTASSLKEIEYQQYGPRMGYLLKKARAFE